MFTCNYLYNLLLLKLLSDTCVHLIPEVSTRVFVLLRYISAAFVIS